ncbi:MAG: DNA-packaging protein [Acidimicrobiales bacterium]|nr:DNA-packaging protein [Acidimicrobiales bacterium]
MADLTGLPAGELLARASPHVRDRLVGLVAWHATRHAHQTPPDGDWGVWVLSGGRGSGKTLGGAQWLADQAMAHPDSRWAVIAPTFADGRDTCVEGVSGLLAAVPATWVAAWNRSLGELVLVNQARIKLFSAAEPERLRGPQHHGAWLEELGAWADRDAWDQAMFGLRLGVRPRVVVTTTPRSTPLLRELWERAGHPDGAVRLVRTSTWANRAHLSAAALAELEARYGGTRLGRQELEGELLDDVEGALWQRAWIDGHRDPNVPVLHRAVVGVDPPATAGGDECGIVTVGLAGADAWVLGDDSLHGSPERWAAQAVGAYHRFAADRVVAEVNQGGDMVVSVIKAVNPMVPVQVVRATGGKAVRAEPVAALYEQGWVHHAGAFPALEDQMCQWVPGEGGSPDRVDACVWAVTALFPQLAAGPARTNAELARTRLPLRLPPRQPAGRAWSAR